MTQEYDMFSEEQQEQAIAKMEDYLPEDATLLQLSFTGGRAFGWGPENTDIDLRGYFITDDEWFTKCHLGRNPFDCVLRNIHSWDDPDIFFQRWNIYYDWGNQFYEHEEWDQDWFLSHCSRETVEYAYPHNIRMQVNRMESNFQARSACHSYKEIMIPLHYLRTGEIESNVNVLHEEGDFDLDGLPQAVETYREHHATTQGLDEDMIKGEVYRLFDELGFELEKHTSYTHTAEYTESLK